MHEYYGLFEASWDIGYQKWIIVGLCKTCYGTFKGRTKGSKGKERIMMDQRGIHVRKWCQQLQRPAYKRSVCQQLEARSQVLGHMSLDASMRMDGNARSLCAS